MLICQNICHDIQPSTDPDDNVDWTLSSRLYDNLHEIPSFIALHRQSAAQVTSTVNVDPNMLQLKQLQVYNTVAQHLGSNELLPLYMIVTGTAGTGNFSCKKNYVLQHPRELHHIILKVTLYILCSICQPKVILRNYKDRSFKPFSNHFWK